MRRVFDTLLKDPQRLDALITRITARIRAEVPEYARVTDLDLRRGDRRIVVAALAQLREGRLPDEAELNEIMEVSRERARNGISLAAVLSAYRAAGHEFWAAVSTSELGRAAGDAALLSTMELVWRWLDTVMVTTAAAHRVIELQSVREDEQRIGDALRTLLLEPASVTVGRQQLVHIGLNPDAEHRAFRGRLARGATLAALHERASGTVVAAVLRDEVVGLLDPTARLDPLLGTFGVGPACPAAELHRSYHSAGRALRAAARLDRPGVHRLADLRLAGAAVTDPEMTEILTERLLHPLRAGGSYAADVWRAVVSYVGHGLRVDDAAAALHVHPNTLRHRLARFTELTDVDFRNTTDVAEVWWLATAVPELPVSR